MKNQIFPRIMLVEDDSKLSKLVSEYLTGNGFSVVVESRGDRAVARILNQMPDLVVLDLMLPGLDGLSVCREVRPRYRGPILILTARADETDEVVGLEIGADDYLTKPVRPRVLLARITTLLRRAGPTHNVRGSEPVREELDNAENRRIAVGALVVDAANRTASISDEPLELTTAEFDLLWLLALYAGQVLSRERIYEAVRGIPWNGIDRSIDLRIARLRRKLSDNGKKPQRIKSVRGTGYLLAAEP
jgi:two-component system, OmpR family, response regulator RstA